MSCLGHERYKIPKSVVGGRCLWHFIVGFGFYGVHQIWKFHGILNKEYRNIVAHEIVIAFIGIKFNGETPNVASQISGATKTSHRRKAREYRRDFSRLAQKGSFGKFLHRSISFKYPVRPGTTRMND